MFVFFVSIFRLPRSSTTACYQSPCVILSTSVLSFLRLSPQLIFTPTMLVMRLSPTSTLCILHFFFVFLAHQSFNRKHDLLVCSVRIVSHRRCHLVSLTGSFRLCCVVCLSLVVGQTDFKGSAVNREYIFLQRLSGGAFKLSLGLLYMHVFEKIPPWHSFNCFYSSCRLSEKLDRDDTRWCQMAHDTSSKKYSSLSKCIR